MSEQRPDRFYNFELDSTQFEQLKWVVDNYRPGDFLRVLFRRGVAPTWVLVRNSGVERAQAPGDSDN